MRINLALFELGRRDDDLSRLLKALTNEFAAEYAMDERSGWMYMFSSSISTREIFAETLASKGWKISAYSLPPAFDDKTYSWGYVIADDCDRLVQWKLAN